MKNWKIKSFPFVSFLCLIFAFTCFQLAFGQVNFNWKDQGPDNMGGRTRALAIKKDGTMFAGSANGGLWSTKINTSNPTRTNWSQVEGFNRPTGNRNSSASVTSIAIDPNNENIMYVGTGELAFRYDNVNYGDLRQSESVNLNTVLKGHLGFAGLPGQGVYVSLDGGQTFSNNNATWTEDYPTTNYNVMANPWVSVQKIVVNNSRAIAATLIGLFYSDDNFATVKAPIEEYSLQPGQVIKPEDKLEQATVLDIEVGNDGTIYASTNRYIFISRDNGTTFTEFVTDTLLPRIPATDKFANNQLKQRIEMAVAPSNKNIIYAAEIANKYLCGVWRSEDAGKSWSQIGPRSSAFDDPTSESWNPTRGQGLSNFSLMVDPSDPDHLYMGSVEWREYSKKGGWLNVAAFPVEQFPWNPAYVPGGQHTIVSMPGDPSVYYIGTNAEIIRGKEKGFTGNFIFGETDFSPATGNFNTSSLYGVAPTLNGELIANSSNRGIILKENTTTQSFRPVEGRSASGLGAGAVATSKFNPDHSIVAGSAFVINRSIDGGKSYQSFFEDFQGVAPGCLAKTLVDKRATKESSPDASGYGTTPFALDEVYNHNEAADEKYVSLGTVALKYKKIPNGKFGQPDEPDTLSQPNLLTSLSYNPKKEQYLFVGGRDILWRVTNPFGTQAGYKDTLTGWAAIADGFQNSDNFPGKISTIAVSGDTTHTVWVGTSDGRLYRLKNAHKPCFYKIVKTPDGQRDTLEYSPNPAFKKEQIITPKAPFNDEGDIAPNRWLSNVIVKPNAPDTIIITYAGYDEKGAQTSSLLYACFNATAEKPTFHSLQNDESLPFAPIFTGMFHPTEPNKWFAVGTEYGVYVCDPAKFNANNEPVPFVEANSGDMFRVPVFQFAHQQYGYANVLGDFIVVVKGETLRVELGDIAQFFADSINYTQKDENNNIVKVLGAKHTNIISQRLNVLAYSDLANYRAIYAQMSKFLDPKNTGTQRVVENQLVTSSNFSPRILAELNIGSDKLTFIRNEGSLLPSNVDSLIGKIYIATYGRGVMRSGILGAGKVTDRPKSDHEVYVSNNQLMRIYPNPTQDLTTIAVKMVTQANVKIEVMGLDGRIVLESNYSQVPNGIQKFDIQMGKLPQGVYVVKTTVHGNGVFQSQATKITKENND